MISAGLQQLFPEGGYPPEAPEQLARYGELLLEKNKVMNLTAIRDPEGVAHLHMLDCAALLGCADFSGRTLIDVGTGAGFPGLVLKILVPSLQVTLLDSLGKRVTWLGEVIRELGLTGAAAVHARAEELSLQPDYRDRYDFAAARAVTGLPALAELCLPYVKPGGLFLSMKALDSEKELAGAASAIRRLGGRREQDFLYTIPDTDVTRRVAAVRKVSPTPAGFPRRWAKIQKEPL